MSPLFGPPDQPSGSNDDFSLLRLINAVLRNRSAIALTGILFAAAAATLTVLAPRTFSTTTTFFPQGRQSAGGAMMGLAAQFGLSVPAGDATQSPQFYTDLLQSRPVLEGTVESSFTVTTDSGPVTATLVDLYGASETEHALRRETAMDALKGMMSAEVSPRTGVVILKVTARDRVLAQQIATRLLELLNEFNLRRRQSLAQAERSFAEERLAEVQASHRAAENRLMGFLQNNRDYLNSPTLRFEHERLARDVAVQQQLVASLTQSYEQSRLEEVRDTPVLTIVTPPELPVRPDRRWLLVRTLLAGLAGVTLGILVAVGRDWFGTAGRVASEEVEEFGRLRRETAADVLRPWRPLARLLRRRAAT